MLLLKSISWRVCEILIKCGYYIFVRKWWLVWTYLFKMLQLYNSLGTSGDAIWDSTLIGTVSEKIIFCIDSVILLLHNYSQLQSKCRWSMTNLISYLSKQKMAPVWSVPNNVAVPNSVAWGSIFQVDDSADFFFLPNDDNCKDLRNIITSQESCQLATW